MNFKIKAFCYRAKLGFSYLSIQAKKLLKSATIIEESCYRLLYNFPKS